MHYSADRLRRSLGHFVAGKAITAIASIVLLVLLARVLPKPDYAVYVTLQAVVLLIGAITSFGIIQALMRYVPELMAAGEHAALYRLIWRSLASRLVVIGGGLALFASALPLLEDRLGLGGHRTWVLAYLGVGLFRLLSFMLSRVMEALLWQRLSQYSLAGAASARLVATAALVATGQLTLPAVVCIELAAEAGALAAMLLGLRRQIARDPKRDAGDGNWAAMHGQRMSTFGRWAYFSSLCGQLGTSSPYRLLAAALLTADGTALLGFAFSITDLLYRFMPARLGQTVLRSILVARQTLGADRAQLLRWLSLNFRVNAVLLALFAIGCVAVGDRAGALLTAGKYTGSGPLLAAMAAVLVLDVLRVQFETLAQVIERTSWTFWGNAALVAGVLATPLLVPHIGLWALPGAALIGQLASLLVYTIGLRADGAASLLDRRTVSFLLLLDACAVAIRWALHDNSWWLSAPASLASFVLACVVFRPVRKVELVAMRRRQPTKAAGS